MMYVVFAIEIKSRVTLCFHVEKNLNYCLRLVFMTDLSVVHSVLSASASVPASVQAPIQAHAISSHATTMGTEKSSSLETLNDIGSDEAMDGASPPQKQGIEDDDIMNQDPKTPSNTDGRKTPTNCKTPGML